MKKKKWKLLEAFYFFMFWKWTPPPHPLNLYRINMDGGLCCDPDRESEGGSVPWDWPLDRCLWNQVKSYSRLWLIHLSSIHPSFIGRRCGIVDLKLLCRGEGRGGGVCHWTRAEERKALSAIYGTNDANCYAKRCRLEVIEGGRWRCDWPVNFPANEIRWLLDCFLDCIGLFFDCMRRRCGSIPNKQKTKKPRHGAQVKRDW